MMSKLAKNSRFQTIKDIPNLAFNLNLLFNLYHSVFELLASSFSIKFKYADFLGENMASYYIRLCYFNFVKIYSYISNTEIVRINQKVVKRLNDRTMPRESAQLVADIDPFGIHGSSQNTFKKQAKTHQEQGGRKKHSFPILLSKLHLKVVLNIALNRNETAKSIFYQFRIMEFFYKEIDLEFEINQIKERFHKVRNNAKERASRATSPKKAFEEKSEESETDSQDINIYNQASKLKKKESIFAMKQMKDTGFVPKLNFKNLTSGDNPLKISSKNNPESSNASNTKPSGHALEFVDRITLPVANKLAGLKLNINLQKLAQKPKDIKDVLKPQISMPGQSGKFNLDFSKLANKPTESIDNQKPVIHQPLVPAIPIGKSENSSPLKIPGLGIPGIGSTTKLSLGGIGKLNFANIERGTPIDIPDLPGGFSSDTSNSSQSVHIDYKEVEKVKMSKLAESKSSSIEEEQSFGDEISLGSESKEEEIAPTGFNNPMIMKLAIPQREGQIPPAIQVPSESDDDENSNSKDGSSSSSVIGFMPPPSMGFVAAGGLGIGKCK